MSGGLYIPEDDPALYAYPPLTPEQRKVVEAVLRYADFEGADEIFATGNASKVLPVTRIGERALQPGPLYRKAREFYWAFAHSS